MRWPWRWIFPLSLNERFCRTCGFPYHDNPLPKETITLASGQVNVVVYPAGGFRRNEYIVRIGRVKSGGKQVFLSEYIPLSELEDVLLTLTDLEQWASANVRPVKRR